MQLLVSETLMGVWKRVLLFIFSPKLVNFILFIFY